MNNAADISADLTALVMNNEYLAELEVRLSQFNLFRILKADQHELRHSNMLAWLFDLSESHGLHELFLRRWLMEVMNNAAKRDADASFISPVWVDAAGIHSVQVKREWHNLDVLIKLDVSVLGKKELWVVGIENKVNARQGRDQLRRYRKTIEEKFSDADHCACVFLTKRHENPDDSMWLISTYSDVLIALEQCLGERADTIGAEPLFLMRQYTELLKEDFMDDSEIAQLARAIYQRHAVAIDYIFECKIDPIFELTNRLEKRLESQASKLEIVMSRTGKGRIRFLPLEWDTVENRKGSAWGDNSHYLVFELDFYPKTVELNMLSGDAPDEWTDIVWACCESAPLQKSQKAKPRRFLKSYRGRSEITVNGATDLDLEETEEAIFSWVVDHMKTKNFRAAVKILTGCLRELH